MSEPSETQSLGQSTYTARFVQSDISVPQATHPTEVSIKKVANGFIVVVGCQTFVSQGWKEVSEGLGLFFSKPEEAIKKYYNKF